jgi:hypothetical protein
MLLAACGGGGGGGSGGGSAPGGGDTPVVTPPPPPSAFSVGVCNAAGIKIAADTTIVVGKVAGATVQACNSTLGDIKWTQVSGPSVTLQADQSPTVAFDGIVEGTVRLRADVTLASGAAASQTVDVVVAPITKSGVITLRSDHSVRQESETSVRAWTNLAFNETISSIVWTQTGGPTVAMDTTDNKVLIITTPKVTADAILNFRATITTSTGRTDSDEVAIGIEYQSTLSATSYFGPTERVHPYRAASAYASVLARCTYDARITSNLSTLCSAGELPLLQADAGTLGTPSVGQIMSRVLVSHDFLGANFESFLQNQDPNGDFKRLLGGVTAIVIGAHVRPSFYTSLTGAIYLDAENFWLTASERDVVAEVPDYRLAFAAPFKFTHLTREVLNNDYADRYFAPDVRTSRSSSDLAFTTGRLLYHELGHASDFFSPTNRALDPSLTIYGNVISRIAARTLPSDLLAQQYPLQSAEMKSLTSALYLGTTPTPTETSYTAAQVGAFFGPDRATDDYAYTAGAGQNSREDLAMLYEEFMMQRRFGVRYDTAYTNLYTSGMTGSQLIIAFGERGRIAEPAIKPRIKLVLANIFPSMPPSEVDALPAPIMFGVGTTWTSSLALNAPPGATRLLASVTTSNSAPDPRLKQDLKTRNPHH